MTEPERAQSRVAVITGAAGGIGEATSRIFADRGYSLVLLDYNRESLHALGAQLASGTGILALDGDLGDLGFCEAAVRAAVDRFSHIDVLVNMAAWREITTMSTISVESWQRTLDVSLTSPAFLSRWCAPHMPPGGAIINISSLNARQASGFAPAYVAAKGGLDALTYELSALYGPRGIRVLSLALGAIDTAMSHDAEAGSGPNALRDFAEDIIPLRRFGTAEETALAIEWFASPAASYLTGTVIEMDGGWFHHHLTHTLKQQQIPTEYK